MPKKPSKAMTPEDILLNYPEPVILVADFLRKLLKMHNPDFYERAYPVWKAIGIRHPKAGYICGIFPFEDCVKLVYEIGILLNDPEGILLGDGKQVRYLEFKVIEDIPEEDIKQFADESIHIRLSRKS